MARLVVLLACALASTNALSICTMPAVRTAAQPQCTGMHLQTIFESSRVSPSTIVMAVPKKRTSKMKTRSRKANWFAKAKRQVALAISRGKSAKYDPLTDPKYSFSKAEEEEEEDETPEKTAA